MTDDLARARQHLKKAESLAPQHPEDATAHASIAIGQTLQRIADLLDRAAAPLRAVMHDSPSPAPRTDSEQARTDRLGFEADQSARRAQERWDRDSIRRQQEAQPVMPADVSGDLRVENAGRVGIFGQMGEPRLDETAPRAVADLLEEHPNALEDPEEH